MNRAEVSSEKKIVLQFTALTFCIAYGVSGVLIILGQFGYRFYGMVYSLQQFAMNIPFAVYILSPAIASYIVLKKNEKISGFREWVKPIIFIKNKLTVYLLIVGGIVLYFGIRMIAAGREEMQLPFYMFLLSLPGNFIIGGLEEAGWTYVLQPRLDKKYGFILASAAVGVIWIFWHIPLFFIPGTNHCEGMIDFWMFNVQVMSLSFFRGAVCRIAGKGRVSAYVLFHTMFNAASSLFGPVTWSETVGANTAMIVFSIIIVIVDKRFRETFYGKF
ncbi:MAG TPA: CPBP family intramembrane metalloprotease [Candidatus Mediterraneibacter cottocaccae]|nr:CPBP family intramembrane metalloprotease [Candidatus Mediterraneibacter cottocaccae]